MVTAEMAVGLTGLVVMLLGLLWVVAVVTAQVRSVDAARDTARARARGESVAVSRAAGRRGAPDGARIELVRHDGVAEVEVRARVRPPWSVLSGLGAVRVSGHAVVALEPGEGTRAPARQQVVNEPGVVPGSEIVHAPGFPHGRGAP